MLELFILFFGYVACCFAASNRSRTAMISAIKVVGRWAARTLRLMLDGPYHGLTGIEKLFGMATKAAPNETKPVTPAKKKKGVRKAEKQSA